jgi:hypothetical protein
LELPDPQPMWQFGSRTTLNPVWNKTITTKRTRRRARRAWRALKYFIQRRERQIR